MRAHPPTRKLLRPLHRHDAKHNGQQLPLQVGVAQLEEEGREDLRMCGGGGVGGGEAHPCMIVIKRKSG